MRRVSRAVIACLLLTIAPCSGAFAANEPAPLTIVYNTQTKADFRVGLQTRLAWTGDYSGPFDGDINARGLRAIRDFQARNGLKADGVISEAMLSALVAASDQEVHETGFKIVEDTSTGIRIGVPLALVTDAGPTDLGRVWRSESRDIEMETVRISGKGKTLEGLYAQLEMPSSTRSVESKSMDAGFFTITGTEGERHYVMHFAGKGDDLQGFTVSYETSVAAKLDRVVTVATNLFDPFGAAQSDDALVAENGRTPFERMMSGEDRVAQADSAATGASLLAAGVHSGGFDPSGSAKDVSESSSGSGFVVSSDGWVLTNAHVAGSCQKVMVGQHGPADTIYVDKAHDLALVHVSGALARPLPIAAGVPRLGEDVLALGFPLRSILADSLNVTRGNVSSLLGLMNDPRYLQISAPIQPGNSGGPLLDLSGRVVGVVTAKLNAVAVADVTGDIPQSINFAIRPDAAAKFMQSKGIDFVTAKASKTFASVADTTANAQDSVLPVLCLGEK